MYKKPQFEVSKCYYYTLSRTYNIAITHFPTSNSTMAPIQFGVLMIRYQALDVVGPLDILSSSSKEMVNLAILADPGMEALAGQGIDIEFHHINKTMDSVELTSGFKVLPTTTCDTCPPLDFLLVGGPDPFNFTLDDRFADFIRAHVESGKTLFTTCTGAWAIASTGVLDGKNATVNHSFVEHSKIQYPKVKWTKEKQWVIDGNIYTAGGACAGMDMMTAWVSKNYGAQVAGLGRLGLDFEPRDVDGNRLPPQQHWVTRA
jgi:transcriptional regulator GlxA family with amidase domain